MVAGCRRCRRASASTTGSLSPYVALTIETSATSLGWSVAVFVCTSACWSRFGDLLGTFDPVCTGMSPEMQRRSEISNLGSVGWAHLMFLPLNFSNLWRGGLCFIVGFGTLVGLSGSMFHCWCPVPVQVRTNTQTHRETHCQCSDHRHLNISRNMPATAGGSMRGLEAPSNCQAGVLNVPGTLCSVPCGPQRNANLVSLEIG